MPSTLSEEQMFDLKGFYYDNAEQVIKWLFAYWPKFLWEQEDDSMTIGEGREQAKEDVLEWVWSIIETGAILRGSCNWSSGKYVWCGKSPASVILKKLQYETKEGPEFRKSFC